MAFNSKVEHKLEEVMQHRASGGQDNFFYEPRKLKNMILTGNLFVYASYLQGIGRGDGLKFGTRVHKVKL